MPDWPEILQAQKSASTVLVLFVPSVDRFDESIDQEYWVTEEAENLRDFLMRLGEEGRQGAVGFVVDRDYLEIRFPLEEE